MTFGACRITGENKSRAFMHERNPSSTFFGAQSVIALATRSGEAQTKKPEPGEDSVIQQASSSPVFLGCGAVQEVSKIAKIAPRTRMTSNTSISGRPPTMGGRAVAAS